MVISWLEHVWKNYDCKNTGNIGISLHSLAINVPEWVINTVESAIYGFVWKGKKDRIKRTVLINNFRNGGLNMVEIRSKITSLKANVVKRFFENQSDTLWKECFTQHLNYFGGKLLFQCDYDVKCLGTEIPAYYLHVLECWRQFYSKEILDETIQSLSSCIVWNNSHIQIEKKSIFWEDFYEAGLIYLGDLFDSNGSLRTFQYWVCKGINPGRFLQWMSLIDAVPRNWISAIKGKGLTNIKRSLKFVVTKIRLDRNTLSISSLNSKRIYTRIVLKKSYFSCCCKLSCRSSGKAGSKFRTCISTCTQS